MLFARLPALCLSRGRSGHRAPPPPPAPSLLPTVPRRHGVPVLPTAPWPSTTRRTVRAGLRLTERRSGRGKLMPDSSRTAPTARALSRASAQPRQPRPNAAPACPCRRLRSAPPRSTTPRRGCAARPPGAPLRCPQPGGVDKEVRATFSAALLLLSRLALRQRARATEPGGKGGRRPEWVSVGGGRSPPAGEVLPLPGGVGRRAAAEPEAAGSLVAPRFALLPVPTPSGLGAECEAARAAGEHASGTTWAGAARRGRPPFGFRPPLCAGNGR